MTHNAVPAPSNTRFGIKRNEVDATKSDPQGWSFAEDSRSIWQTRAASWQETKRKYIVTAQTRFQRWASRQGNK